MAARKAGRILRTSSEIIQKKVDFIPKLRYNSLMKSQNGVQMKRNFLDSMVMAMLVDCDIKEMDLMPDDEVLQACCVRIKWSWEDDGSEIERFVFVHKNGDITWSTFNDHGSSKPVPEWFVKQIEEAADEYKE